MSKNIATSIIIIFLFHFFYCINFNNVEICSAYIAYPSHTGHYGEKGVTSPENYFSARKQVASVYSATRNKFYIFGGYGYGINGESGFLNDLWEYDISKNQWTWISGSKTTNAPAVMHEKGIPHPENTPSSRYGACMTEDLNGNLWLFGGYGHAISGGLGELADLWMFNGSMWTFVKGSEDPNAQGVLSDLRIPDPNAYPSAKHLHVCWTDNNGHLWVYGGYDVGETWRFDGENWTTWNYNMNLVHGEIREFSHDYCPSPREHFFAATNPTKTAAYILGGKGRFLNPLPYSDIWKFESDKGWALWGGKADISNPIPGTIKVPSESNLCGSRMAHTIVVDKDENIWLFGGETLLNSFQNDLWVYNHTYFVWMAGNPVDQHVDEVRATGPNEFSYDNYPGTLRYGTSFIDNQGFIYILAFEYHQGHEPVNTIWKIAYTYECFGKSICKNQTFDEICSGNGKCVDKDLCSCNEGYTGYECQFPICFGKNSNDSNVCSSKGSCILPDTCECIHGQYTGSECQFPICNGISSNDSTVCNSRGYCISPNNCSCTNSAHWTGSDCEIPICYSKLATDSQVCSGRGTCVSPNSCSCLIGYGGPECQFSVCNGKLSNDLTVCNSRGNCISPNNCSCTNSAHWTGSDCEIPICFSKSSADSKVCSGHGECISPNNCSCHENWFSEECNITMCHGIRSDDITVCSGHGVCNMPNNCSCVDGYSGNDCSVVILRKDENPEFNPSWLWFLLLIIPAIVIVVIIISIIVILKRKKTVQKEKDKEKASTELENIKIAQMMESFKPKPFLLE